MLPIMQGLARLPRQSQKKHADANDSQATNALRYTRCLTIRIGDSQQ